ncbi:ABC transporter permease [Bacillus carboniphilus]|uniref:ABC transporter permease n=1 Tax=Bacillus carboniphilus TaxID=86663 RepID=A0ABY9JTW4_9BACI|nr:ABC transporter permease [Bacillus carboniphilus]WLR42847.1 ABC transporter permease [Bacillus carboniphilus]
MNSVEEIWKKRLLKHYEEMQKYLKYMLNDHLLIVLVILAGAAAIGYSNWLTDIPEGFPTIWVIIFSFTLLLTFVGNRTLLEEPDQIFLLPLEEKMSSYFRSALVFSFVTQMGWMLLVAVILAPLYSTGTSYNGNDYLFLLLQLVLIRAWNHYMIWMFIHYIDGGPKWIDSALRIAVNFVAVFLIVQQSWLLAIVVYIVMIGLLLFFRKMTISKPIRWNYLIEEEQKKQQRFYRLANLFTDVPHVKNEVKRRKIFDFVLRMIPFQNKETFRFLYTASFLRSGDYIGLWFRLTVIGGLFLIFMDLPIWGIALLIVAIIYLTGVQLSVLYKKYDFLILPDLYPILKEEKRANFSRLLFVLLVIQGSILSIVSLVSVMSIFSLLVFLAQGLFAYFLVYQYILKRYLKEI